jgi:hypothetical protein
LVLEDGIGTKRLIIPFKLTGKRGETVKIKFTPGILWRINPTHLWDFWASENGQSGGENQHKRMSINGWKATEICSELGLESAQKTGVML